MIDLSVSNYIHLNQKLFDKNSHIQIVAPKISVTSPLMVYHISHLLLIEGVI